jgi:FKBP-type peptidyl-prolyl cis-trans isomerase FklB
MMPVGSKWKIYVPYDLAYGNRETGKIKPFSALIFEIELLEIVELPKSNPTAPATK